jgi:hypothetical protein
MSAPPPPHYEFAAQARHIPTRPRSETLQAADWPFALHCCPSAYAKLESLYPPPTVSTPNRKLSFSTYIWSRLVGTYETMSNMTPAYCVVQFKLQIKCGSSPSLGMSPSFPPFSVRWDSLKRPWTSPIPICVSIVYPSGAW